MRNAFVALILAVLAFGTVVTSTHDAQAQTPPANPGAITAFPQGMIGVGLLGAEVATTVLGVARVRAGWAWAVFPAVGLIGGGVGGFFIDQAIDSAMPLGSGPHIVSTSLLVVGLGLVIPSLILFASATQYRPDETNTQADDTTANTPLEESTGPSTAPSSGASGGGSTSTPVTNTNTNSEPTAGGTGGARGSRRGGPEALLNYIPGSVRFGLPLPGLLSSYSLQEMRQYGLNAQTEWRLPVISAQF